jgi:hypothetical protein
MSGRLAAMMQWIDFPSMSTPREATTGRSFGRDGSADCGKRVHKEGLIEDIVLTSPAADISRKTPSPHSCPEMVARCIYAE